MTTSDFEEKRPTLDAGARCRGGGEFPLDPSEREMGHLPRSLRATSKEHSSNISKMGEVDGAAVVAQRMFDMFGGDPLSSTTSNLVVHARLILIGGPANRQSLMRKPFWWR